jgi:CheY-like chemotaxis protein
VIDDEPDAVSMSRRILEDHAMRTTAASSADAALDVLARESFDVIVSDIGMPGRDGYDLIAELRARGIGTPALAVTAFAHSDDRRKALAAGYQAHISKPIDAAQLLAKLASVLHGNGSPARVRRKAGAPPKEPRAGRRDR